MERYKILEELGDGTCGCVYKAINRETCETVAVKKMKRKFYFWDECVNLREVKALRKLNHPNIIKLKEVVRENNELFFIFEHMDYNLYQIMRDRDSPFSEEEIRNFMSQVLQGLAHMHRVSYFHRDLKPENLLVKNLILKIADFGLAREVTSTPPYTEYVSTRWYRAPEVLLQSWLYTPAIDMWAVGAILAELFTLSPIFPGESEMDQLYKIVTVLGRPHWNAFPEAKNISRLVDISYTEQLCSWDPSKRPTADQALQHPFFHVSTWIPRPLHDSVEKKLEKTGSKPNLELNLWNFSTQPDDCFLGLTLGVKPSNQNPGMGPNVSQGLREEILFGSDYKEYQEKSAFWSLLSPDQSRIHAPVDSALSLSFSNSIQQPSVGVLQSTGLTMPSLQPNLLDCPLLAMPTPFRQGNWL
ncbi:serine/threonine-protein kinase MHK isoform X2 [Punica granatum]|uniref:Serine/threonine-protein kinase MHK isoform X2 n=1 Tax=Punica granatum TaxID=22663 RepID=A0A6P8BVR6_PUNGR|nr:serine/threonine-protein kinase MHK isoform X2 [Punica granatum]